MLNLQYIYKILFFLYLRDNFKKKKMLVWRCIWFPECFCAWCVPINTATTMSICISAFWFLYAFLLFFWHPSSHCLPFRPFLCHRLSLCLKVCHYCLNLSIKIASWISLFSFRPLSLRFHSREWVSSARGKRPVCRHDIQQTSDLCYTFDGVTIW